MTVIQKMVVYVPDSLVHEARRRGLRNVSEFVRDRLTEYIRDSEPAAKVG